MELRGNDFGVSGAVAESSMMNKRMQACSQESMRVTRRRALQCTVVGVAGQVGAGLAGQAGQRALGAEESGPELLQDAMENLESYLTPQDEFRDVSRGNPKPHRLSEEEKRAVGLTRDTWRLEVLSDPEYPATLTSPMTVENDGALDFKGLMKLAEHHRVRFPKIMTCLNIGCPLGMGIWEGVPLRDVLWMTGPQENWRRVYYHGYHNEDPEQMFRSSLPVGRVLEDPFGLPPVILCYKLNGHWLSSERGGPVRMVVPEAYGFKSIKWLTHVFLSNLPHANDTYAEKNNDIDSPLKTFAATLSIPRHVSSHQPFVVTGYAQVGISGLKKVQVWLHRDGDSLPTDRQYFSDAPWQDAEILPPPKHWGGGLPENRLPESLLGFDPTTHRPERWPMPLSKAHWAFSCRGLSSGKYMFRCRTFDENNIAQPLPRPFRKSGHAAIEQKAIVVED